MVFLWFSPKSSTNQQRLWKKPTKTQDVADGDGRRAAGHEDGISAGRCHHHQPGRNKRGDGFDSSETGGLTMITGKTDDSTSK